MHKLMEYICEELEDLERKAEKEGKLSMTEIEYGDKLAHFKKNLLSSEQMWDDSEYSMAGGSYGEGSYARGGNRGGSSREGGSSYARGRGRNVRRDSRGRYSSEGVSYEDGYSRNADITAELRELMMDAPDEKTRMEFQKVINKLESMM